MTTGNEYMALLQHRADEWTASLPKGGLRPRFGPSLEWFIRDGDATMVELPTPVTAPIRPVSAPRKYRPATYWREQIAILHTRMAALAEPLITDRAAAGGVALGVRRTARIQRQEDNRLQRYAILRRRLAATEGMFRKAESREKATQ